MKVLPAPGALSSRRSPPSSWRELPARWSGPGRCRRACRLMLLSAWAKASKMRSCFGVGMPVPVSATAIPIARPARVARRSRSRSIRSAAENHAEPPASVNLMALDSRFFEDLLQPLRSVRAGEGSRRRRSTLESRAPWRPPAARTCAARRSPARRARTGSTAHLQLAGLDLGQVQDVVDEGQQLLARRVDDLRRTRSARGEVAVPFSARMRDRIMTLLSGVRSSCDMLARNSDLVLVGPRSSSAAFASSRRWAPRAPGCSSTSAAGLEAAA